MTRVNSAVPLTKQVTKDRHESNPTSNEIGEEHVDEQKAKESAAVVGVT
jgi:hypothetical protein